MGLTAVVIPVPAMESVVGPRFKASLPDYRFDDPGAVHAHITVLGPFADPTPELLRDLTECFAEVQPFDFALDHLYTYQDMWVSLRPDPDQPFRDLTRRLWQRYPDHPPHGGRLREFQPHLTVEYRLDLTCLESIEAEVGPMLPLHTRAEAACLIEYAPGRSRVVATFPFGWNHGLGR